MGNSEANDGYVKEELLRIVGVYRQKQFDTDPTDTEGFKCILGELLAELEGWAGEPYDTG